MGTPRIKSSAGLSVAVNSKRILGFVAVVQRRQTVDIAAQNRLHQHRILSGPFFSGDRKPAQSYKSIMNSLLFEAKFFLIGDMPERTTTALFINRTAGVSA